MLFYRKLARRTLVITICAIVSLILAASYIIAASSYSISSGQTLTINLHGVCRNVYNPNGSTYFIPTNTATEWASVVASSVFSSTSCGCSYLGQSYGGGKCAQTGTGALLAANADSGNLSWPSAVSACSNMGSGWHLPTMAELNILYSSRGSVGGYSSTWYWTTTLYTPITTQNTYQVKRFDTGQESWSIQGDLHYVRCVKVSS